MVVVPHPRRSPAAIVPALALCAGFVGVATGQLPLTALWATVAAVMLAATLLRKKPFETVVLGYIISLALTAFAAGVGIAAGGYLEETGLIGRETGSFGRLLLFYVIFVIGFLAAFRRTALLGQPAAVSAGLNKIFLLGLLIGCIAAGVLSGLLNGFALLKGVNRFAIRNEAGGDSSALFNLYLNNRVFIGIAVGLLCADGRAGYRALGRLFACAALVLSVAHGEQFMATLQQCFAIVLGFVTGRATAGRSPNGRKIAVIAGLAAGIAAIALFLTYSAQGYAAIEKIGVRLLLQGQMWYAVDSSADVWQGEAARGQFSTVAGHFLSWAAPDDVASSGLRQVMNAFGVPELMDQYDENNVTFTMGQMAVPVYWFGYAGGALFVFFTGAFFGAITRMVLRVVVAGGAISVFLAAKLFSNMLFGLQQGEYWYLFGSRTLLVAALVFLLSRLPKKI